jgi:deoxyribonuclease (pyrimidine dimer)
MDIIKENTNMTRINVGIPPAELTDKHLIAEHREIKRIPNCIAKGKYNMEGIPDRFKLGKGHVKFFYNKLLHLKKRYIKLHEECIKREFNVQNYIKAWDNVPEELMNDYKVRASDIRTIRKRINEKLNK